MATLAATAGILVLSMVSASVTLFVWPQVVLSAAHVAVMGTVLCRNLPGTGVRPKMAWKSLLGVYQFAPGMRGITLCSLILTQADEVILSNLLSLEMFGYCTLAGGLAGC